MFTRLIDRNTTIPTRKSQTFSTASDGQTAVSIHVLQGEREMAAQNRTLGRFDLVGIPPAARGVPQIEVTFDIDANGIVHVSARDLGTGKEQKIRIESSSGLAEDEIRRMVHEAEAHAAEDRVEREKAEARNAAESLIYATEKSLADLGNKPGEDEKAAIASAIAELRAALETDEPGVIKAKADALQKAAFHLSEGIYRGGRATGPGSGSRAGSAGASTAEDADYEVAQGDTVAEGDAVADGGKPKA